MVNLRLALLFLLAAFSVAGAADKPIDVWLDVDTSTGVIKNGRNADVDDGLAMIYAFNSPELTIHGVSVQFGNATLEQAMPIAHQVVDDFGPDGLGVYEGAASVDDLGVENEATKALAAALKERPMHVLALGPVTNVATVLKLHPELGERMQSLVIVAARREGFRFGPEEAPQFFFPDANFEKDVEGTQILLDSGVPIVFAGYEVSSHVWLTPADLESLAESSAVGKWIAETSKPWLTQWLVGLQTPGFNPFDTLADLWLTHPELIESIPVTLEIIEATDEQAAQKQAPLDSKKPYLIATPVEGDSKYLYLTVPKPEAKDVILERLAGRPD